MTRTTLTACVIALAAGGTYLLLGSGAGQAESSCKRPSEMTYQQTPAPHGKDGYISWVHIPRTETVVRRGARARSSKRRKLYRMRSKTKVTLTKRSWKVLPQSRYYFEVEHGGRKVWLPERHLCLPAAAFTVVEKTAAAPASSAGSSAPAPATAAPPTKPSSDDTTSARPTKTGSDDEPSAPPTKPEPDDEPSAPAPKPEAHDEASAAAKKSPTPAATEPPEAMERGTDGKIEWASIGPFDVSVRRSTRIKDGRFRKTTRIPSRTQVVVNKRSVKKFWGSYYFGFEYKGKSGWLSTRFLRLPKEATSATTRKAEPEPPAKEAGAPKNLAPLAGEVPPPKAAPPPAASVAASKAEDRGTDGAIEWVAIGPFEVTVRTSTKMKTGRFRKTKSVRRNTKVTVDKRSAKKFWGSYYFGVQQGEKRGWLSTRFLQLPEAAFPAMPAPLASEPGKPASGAGSTAATTPRVPAFLPRPHRASRYLSDPDPMRWNPALKRAYDVVDRLKEIMDLVEPVSYQRAVAILGKVKGAGCPGFKIASEEKLVSRLHRWSCVVAGECKPYEQILKPERNARYLARSRWKKTCRSTERQHRKLQRRLSKEEKKRDRALKRLAATSRKRKKERYRREAQKATASLSDLRQQIAGLTAPLAACRAQEKAIADIDERLERRREVLDPTDLDYLRTFALGLACMAREAGIGTGEMLSRTKSRRPGICQSRSRSAVRSSGKSFEQKARAFLSTLGIKANSSARRLLRQMARLAVCKRLGDLVTQVRDRHPDFADLYSLRSVYLKRLPTLSVTQARRAAIAFQKLRVTINVTKTFALDGRDEEGDARGVRQAHRDHPDVLKKLKKQVQQSYTITTNHKRVSAATYISSQVRSHDWCRAKWICAKETRSGPCRVGTRTVQGCCVEGRKWPVKGVPTRDVRLDSFCRTGHAYGSLDLTTSAENTFVIHFRKWLRTDEVPDLLPIMEAKRGDYGAATGALPTRLALEGGTVTRLKRIASTADSAWKIRKVIRKKKWRTGRFLWAARYLTNASGHTFTKGRASLQKKLRTEVAKGRRFLAKLERKAIAAHVGEVLRLTKQLVAQGVSTDGKLQAAVSELVAHRTGPGGPALDSLAESKAKEVVAILDEASPEGGWTRKLRRLRRSLRRKVRDLGARTLVSGVGYGRAARCEAPAGDLGCVDGGVGYYQPPSAWRRVLNAYLKGAGASVLDSAEAKAIAASLEDTLDALGIKNHGNTVVAIARYSSPHWQVRVKVSMAHLHHVDEKLEEKATFADSLVIGGCGSTGTSPIPHGHLDTMATLYRKDGARWREVPHSERTASPLVILGEGPPPHRHQVACTGDKVVSAGSQVSTWASPDGDYYLTVFGCYLDQEGKEVFDGEDNCHMSCARQACKTVGVSIPRYGKRPKTKAACEQAGPMWRWNGPDTKSPFSCRLKADVECEQKLKYFVTGRGRRFWPHAPKMKCGEKVCVHNPDKGRTVVAMVSESGPNCTDVEKPVDHAVLDASPWVGWHLFGKLGGLGKRDRKVVRLSRVDESGGLVALGPIDKDRARVVCKAPGGSSAAGDVPQTPAAGPAPVLRVRFDSSASYQELGPSLFGHKQLLLTIDFDGGPRLAWATQLLDLLKEHRIRAVFFLVGKPLKSFLAKEGARARAVIRRMRDEGHLVGNHTYGHPELVKLSASQRAEQIEGCSREIQKAFAAVDATWTPRIFRFPSMKFKHPQDGDLSAEIHRKYKMIVGGDRGWRYIDSRDYRLRDAQAILSTLKKRTAKRNRGFLLLHEKPGSIQALKEFIPWAKKNGYRFVELKIEP